jgi:hypothetical protein
MSGSNKNFVIMSILKSQHDKGRTHTGDTGLDAKLKT